MEGGKTLEVGVETRLGWAGGEGEGCGTGGKACIEAWGGGDSCKQVRGKIRGGRQEV